LGCNVACIKKQLIVDQHGLHTHSGLSSTSVVWAIAAPCRYHYFCVVSAVLTPVCCLCFCRLNCIIPGPVVLVDGQEMELQAGLAIPVTSMTYSCDGTIYNTDAVPLPCNVLNRTVVRPPPPQQINMTDVLPAQAAPDAANITGVPATTSAAAAAMPLLGSLMAAVLFAALLL
jgi:hypothetical protein